MSDGAELLGPSQETHGQAERDHMTTVECAGVSHRRLRAQRQNAMRQSFPQFRPMNGRDDTTDQSETVRSVAYVRPCKLNVRVCIVEFGGFSTSWFRAHASRASPT